MSGITAIYVMHRDIAFRKKDKRMEKNNNFKKSFELIRIWIKFPICKGVMS